MKRNVPILGLIIGIIFPAIGVLVMSLIWKGGRSFSDFSQELVINHDLASKVLSMGLLVNAIPFIYYTNKRLDLTARGILIATILYALVIILLKFVWN